MPTKYNQLADKLREELYGKGGEESWKMPTEAELAARFQMSRQTVRHALRLLRDEGLIESRRGSGTYTVGKGRKEPSRQVAVISSFREDYIFPTVLHDAQSLLTRHGYSTLVFDTENQVSAERRILLRLVDRPVAGILAEGSKTALPSPNSDLYRRLLQMGVPMVFLHASYAELSSVPCVSDDNYGGGYQLAKYLIGKGHRRIGGIFKCDDAQGPQRYYGSVSAIRDAGLSISDRRFCWFDTQDRLEILERRSVTILHHLLAERLADVTAIICYNDEIAFQLIQILRSAGKRVPEDIAVVSFDNSYYSQIGPVTITSLSHRPKKVGQMAAKQLLRILRGEEVTSVALGWELIERGSA